MMQFLHNIRAMALAAILPAAATAAAQVSVIPEPGTTQIGLDKITLTFADAASVSTNYTADNAPFLSYDGEVKERLSKWGDSVDGNSVALYFNYPIEQSGLWTVTIPAGYISADGAECGEMEYSYDIKALSYTVSPQGSVYAASEITFTFDGFETVDVVEPSYIVLSDYIEKPELTLTTEGNVLTIAFDEIATPGFWYLSISPDALELDGILLSTGIREYLTIVKEPDYQTVVTPADGAIVAELSVITVDFVGATSVEMGYDDEYSWPYLRDNSYMQVGDPISNRLFEGESMVLTLAEPLTAPGTYTLVIPYDGVLVNGDYPEGNLYYTYTVDPTVVEVSEVNAETRDNVVYDLMGRRVNADCDKLPRGIYIIGGRKVAVTR